MARESQLEGRLLRVLDVACNRRAVTLPLGAMTVRRPITINAPSDLLMMADDIEKVNLESGLGGWKSLPFELPPDEETDVRHCVELAKEMRHTVNGVVQFTSPEVRGELESILAGRPDYFYAEYLLGLWHRMNGDEARA